jgi:hypothetical protein
MGLRAVCDLSLTPKYLRERVGWGEWVQSPCHLPSCWEA